MFRRIRFSRSGDGLLWHSYYMQGALAGNAIDHLLDHTERNDEEGVLYVQTGATRNELWNLRSRFPSYGESGEIELGTKGAHWVHAALLTCCQKLSTEQEFHVRVGFYKEDAHAMAGGFLRAVRGLG